MNAAEAESYCSTVRMLAPHKRTVGDEAALALLRELARTQEAYKRCFDELRKHENFARADVCKLCRRSKSPCACAVDVCEQCRERLPCACGRSYEVTR